MGKIEDTKRKALEIMHVKKNARIHQAALSEKCQMESWEKEKNKEKVHHQKQQMKQGLETGKKMATENTMTKAESVKQNLANLREEYRQKKMHDQAESIFNVNNIKNFERD